MGHDILLDTGTNEVELLEFYLGEQSFGINVAKVLQIVPYDSSKLTTIPDSVFGSMGVLMWREGNINLVDLNKVLKREEIGHVGRPIVLVTYFNDVTNGFLVSGVNRIHRLFWHDIKPASPIIEKYSTNVTGSVDINSNEILILDFEFIVSKLFPEIALEEELEKPRAIEDEKKRGYKREDISILFAEDSNFIRMSMVKILNEAGFSKVTAFENGLKAYDYVCSAQEKSEREGRDIADFINVIITDIEMPQMDGLTLCKKIKHDLGYKDMKILIFSSLINQQMLYKCEEVGADGCITKPRSNELISIIENVLK